MNFSYAKLKDAIHFLCDKSTSDGTFMDAVQLNKVLWYADCLMYATRGQSITDARYKRKAMGPVTGANRSAIRDLIDEGAIKEGHAYSPESARYYPTFDAIKAAEDTRLSVNEKEVLAEVHEFVTLRRTTAQISEQSHGDVWRLAENNEELPLFTVFAERIVEPTPEELAEAAA